MKVEEKTYSVPESHLFRLLGICSKTNKCKEFGEVGCQCSNLEFVPKKRGRPKKDGVDQYKQVAGYIT
jgi:hypothetical protein